eukprot:9101833-Pyramimonas_sp.AAC.1
MAYRVENDGVQNCVVMAPRSKGYSSTTDLTPTTAEKMPAARRQQPPQSRGCRGPRGRRGPSAQCGLS